MKREVYIIRWYSNGTYKSTDLPIFKSEEAAVNYAKDNIEAQMIILKEKELTYKIERVVLE